jgi:hypothetical protein
LSSQIYSGPENAGLYTTIIELRCSRGQNRPTQILLLDQREMGETTLKMSWLTPSHLEVADTKHPPIDFQVVESGGIDISVKDLSSAEAGTSK